MILITGCTGFVGSALIRRLIRDGRSPDSIRGLVRHPGTTKDPAFPKEIELVRGDVNDPKSIAAAMEGVTQLIHLVGILVETGLQTFQRIHVEGTRHVVHAAKQAKVKQLIAVTALGTRPNATSHYHQTKWQAEEIIRNSGLSYTIFRPSVIFGPLDNFTNQLATITRYSPIVPILGKGTNRTQPVWIDDFIHCLAQTINQAEQLNETLSIAGPKPLSFKEMMDIIIEVMGKRRITLSIPFALLSSQAWFLERVMPKPPITVDQMIMAKEDNILTEPFPWERFGITPCSFREGIAEYL